MKPTIQPLSGLACVFAVSFALACGPPAFVVHVTFDSEVDVEDGSAVVYEGVIIGEVTNVALRQDDPGRRAQVAVTLGIEDPRVVLRQRDRFRISELRGVPIIEIVPVEDASSALAAGAVVVGEPPFVTKFQETLGAAIESIGEIAAEAIEEALEGIQHPQHPSPGRTREPAKPAQPVP